MPTFSSYLLLSHLASRRAWYISSSSHLASRTAWYISVELLKVHVLFSSHILFRFWGVFDPNRASARLLFN